MRISFTQLRFSWIALAAFMGASLSGVNATAACSSIANAGKCRPACCGKAAPSAKRVRADVLATVGQRIASLDGNTCPNVPCCHCCPQAPAAPEPKQRRAEKNGPDRGRTVEADWLDYEWVCRPIIGAVPHIIIPPSKSPLYLRNSRLLI